MRFGLIRGRKGCARALTVAKCVTALRRRRETMMWFWRIICLPVWPKPTLLLRYYTRHKSLNSYLNRCKCKLPSYHSSIWWTLYSFVLLKCLLKPIFLQKESSTYVRRLAYRGTVSLLCREDAGIKESIVQLLRTFSVALTFHFPNGAIRDVKNKLSLQLTIRSITSNQGRNVMLQLRSKRGKMSLLRRRMKT